MKELLPFLALGFAVALSVALVFAVRLRLSRLAEALGAELSWCGLRGQRGGHEFRYRTGSKNSRPRLSLVDVPVSHELTVLSRSCAGRVGARAGLEHEVAGIEPAFDAAVAVFSDDAEYARALFARPEARQAVQTMLEGTRDRLVLERERLSLQIGRGPCSWRFLRAQGLACAGRSERLLAGLDRMLELLPHLSVAARSAPEPRETWRRKYRRVLPVAAAVLSALAIAAASLLATWFNHGG